MSDALYLRKGAIVPAPTGGDKAIILDTDGTIKSIDSSGTRTAIGGSAAGPDWFGYMASLFQTTSGISPLGWSVSYANSFGATSFPTLNGSSQGFVVGAGATAAYSGAAAGGLIQVAGNTTFADWTPVANQSAAAFMGNVRTKRWMVAYRISIGTTPVGTSAISAGIFCNSNYIGIGYAGAQANWKYVRGASITNISDTGQAIAVDATGATGYITMAIGNFDLVNISSIVNVANSTAPVALEAVSNLPNFGAVPYVGNESTTANTYFLSKVICCCEL